jgi:simple sugar transport system permease protein
MAVTSDTTPSTPGRATGEQAGARMGLLRRALTIREGSIILVTAITIIYFAASTSHFLTLHSFQNLLPSFAPFAIIAAGEVFVMVNGEIDLSVGGTYLVCPFIMHELHHAGLGLYGSLIVALLCCMAVGVINGYFVAVVGITSFVTTLGTLFALSGLTLIISHSTQITPTGTTILGDSTFEKVFGAGTYSELFWAIGIVIILQIALTFTRWGIYTVAVGSNRLGAKEAGINERANIIRNFAVCATLAGLVGVLEATRSTSATPDPTGAQTILFQAISAAVIGGTLLNGGTGTVVGALIGALFLGVLQDGLTFKGVSSNYEDLYIGLGILVAMVININVNRIRTGTAARE